MSEQAPVVAARYVYAGMLVCIAMMAALLWMPALLGALALGYGLGVGQLSRLASAELVGFLLGSAFASTRTVASLERWLLLACTVLVVTNLALLQFAPRLPFLAVRPLAGLAAGVGFGFGLKLCAMSAQPTRYFGIVTGLMSVMMILGFQAIARLIAMQTSAGGAEAEGASMAARMVFAAYAVLAALAACVYLANRPRVAGVPASQSAGAAGLPQPLALLGLLAIVLTFIGQGGTWTFLQTLGVAHGFPVGGVANAMSAFAVMGIAGSLAAAALPVGVPRAVAIGAALLLLWLGLYALHRPQSIGWYVAGCAVGGFYWNFALPLLLGLLAGIDRTGRASVLGGTMSSAGSAIGPLLAGLLVHGQSYQAVGWMTGGFCLAGLVLVWFVEQRRAVAGSLQEAS